MKNNSAEIRRLTQRVADLEGKQQKAEEVGGSQEIAFDGGTVDLDHASGTLRIRHNAKPSVEVRDQLKREGFHWSPTNTAWQRKITDNAIAAAERVTGAELKTKETDQGVALYSRRAQNVGYALDSGTTSRLAPAAVANAEGYFGHLETVLKRERGATDISPVFLRDTGLRDLESRISELFGLKTFYFRSDTEASGLYLPSRPDTVALNLNGGVGLWTVAGHELLHSLKQNHPTLYQELWRASAAVLKNVARYQFYLIRNYVQDGLKAPSDALAREELMADITGRFFHDEQFWRDVADKSQPGFIKRLFLAIRRFLDKLLGRVDTTGHDPFLQEFVAEMDAVRQALARAFAGYAAEKGVTVKGEELLLMSGGAEFTKSVTYQVTKVGRKWLEGKEPGKPYTNQIEINEVTKEWKVGETHTFDAKVHFESSRYGTTVKVYPLTAETKAAELDKAARAEADRWMGYIEERAAQYGTWYDKGVEKLRALDGLRFEDIKTRYEKVKGDIEQRQRGAEIALATRQEQQAADRASSERVDLNVPYAEKDAAKRHGAKWDPMRKVWYVMGKVPDALAKYDPSIQKQQDEAAGIFSVSRGSGYGGKPYHVGETLRNPRKDVGHEFVTVVRADKRYFDEDGLSFGVGDESGHVYSAKVRPATEEEARPLREAETRAKERKAIADGIRALEKQFREHGERPAGMNLVEGERLLDTQNVYGGGDWWVIQPDAIWYVQNNGADGDAWSANNVRTGGAGAIGWRMPYDAEIAVQLREADAVLKETDQGTARFSRRLWRQNEEKQAEDQRDKQDYIVPETPEFDGNETGDLAYTPRSAEGKGIEQLPIRLTVGESRAAHRGFGLMHMAQEGDSDARRKAPAVTNDEAENYARQVADIAKTFNEIYTEGDRVIFRSAKLNKAIIAEKVVDEETGESYYSAVTTVPSLRPVWGNPVWRAGRALLPADRTLKSGAPLSPDRTSQRAGHKTLGKVQTEHFDLSKERERLQAKRQPITRRHGP